MGKSRTLLLCLAPLFASGQGVILKPAPPLAYPGQIDGNSPSFWHEGRLKLFSSTGNPVYINEAESWSGPWRSGPVEIYGRQNAGIWIESAWVDDDGTILAWYHHEPHGLCAGSELTVPRIGAAVSYDGGLTMTDLGIVLESGDPVNCSAKNGFFAGGHGDFSVIADREGGYFYFFFSNYGGPASSHGIAVARLAFEDRYTPAGNVRKYYAGGWDEPGIGGKVTPIYPAVKGWEVEDTDAFWGPAVHFNTSLGQYVMVMNRSCCRSNWPMEGVYISFAMDLSNPHGWGRAEKIMDGREAGAYYPQIVGMGPGESDSLAGEKARLFVQGVSMWEILFPEIGGDTEDPIDEVDPMPEAPLTSRRPVKRPVGTLPQ